MPRAADTMQVSPIAAEGTDHVIHGLAEFLRALLDQQHGAPTSAMMTVGAPTVAQRMPPTTTSAIPATSSAEIDSVIAGNASIQAGRRLDATCTCLNNVIEDYLMTETSVEDRYGILRDLLQRLLGAFHEDVSRLRVLLQLMNRRLPLPTLMENVTPLQGRHAEELRRRLQLHLQGLHGRDPDLPPAVRMTQDWATEQVPTLGAFAMDVMVFLEQGHLTFKSTEEETQSCQEEEGYRPGHDRLRNQPGFHESMLMARHDNQGDMQNYDQNRTNPGGTLAVEGSTLPTSRRELENADNVGMGSTNATTEGKVDFASSENPSTLDRHSAARSSIPDRDSTTRGSTPAATKHRRELMSMPEGSKVSTGTTGRATSTIKLEGSEDGESHLLQRGLQKTKEKVERGKG